MEMSCTGGCGVARTVMWVWSGEKQGENCAVNLCMLLDTFFVILIKKIKHILININTEDYFISLAKCSKHYNLYIVF